MQILHISMYITLFFSFELNNALFNKDKVTWNSSVALMLGLSRAVLNWEGLVMDLTDLGSVFHVFAYCMKKSPEFFS